MNVRLRKFPSKIIIFFNPRNCIKKVCWYLYLPVDSLASSSLGVSDSFSSVSGASVSFSSVLTSPLVAGTSPLTPFDFSASPLSYRYEYGINSQMHHVVLNISNIVILNICSNCKFLSYLCGYFDFFINGFTVNFFHWSSSFLWSG